MTSNPDTKRKSRRTLATVTALGVVGVAALVAVFIATGSGSGHANLKVAPTPVAKPTSAIPQNNGGDGDPDNNGGPSDGDGNI